MSLHRNESFNNALKNIETIVFYREPSGDSIHHMRENVLLALKEMQFEIAGMESKMRELEIKNSLQQKQIDRLYSSR